MEQRRVFNHYDDWCEWRGGGLKVKVQIQEIPPEQIPEVISELMEEGATTL